MTRDVVLTVLVAMIAMLAFARSASAAETSLVPNAVPIDSASYVVSGCTAPKSNCIDEVVPGAVNDADAVTVSAAGPVSITFDLTTLSTAYAVDTVEFNIRTRCVTGGATGNVNTGIYNASNVQIGSTVSIPTTSTWTNTTRLLNGLSINQTTLDGLRLRFTTGACTSGAIAVSAASLRIFYPVVATEVMYPNADRSVGSL